MKKLRPQKVDVLTYPNGTHTTFGSSSPRVRFLDVQGFGIHVYYKKFLQSLIVLIFLRISVAVRSLLRDKLPPFQRVFHSVLLQSLYISFININHVLLYFSISGNIYVHFIVISLLSFCFENNPDQFIYSFDIEFQLLSLFYFYFLSYTFF